MNGFSSPLPGRGTAWWGEGPGVRAWAGEGSNRDHALLITVHHIVSDGWSVGVMVREVAELYAAALEGRTANLPALPIQYADFAVWQRQWLQGDVLSKQVDFWRELLAGAPELDLPTDRPRPAVQSDRGGVVRFRVEPRKRATPPVALHRRARPVRGQVRLRCAGQKSRQIDLCEHVPLQPMPLPDREVGALDGQRGQVGGPAFEGGGVELGDFTTIRQRTSRRRRCGERDQQGMVLSGLHTPQALTPGPSPTTPSPSLGEGEERAEPVSPSPGEGGWSDFGSGG